MSKQGRWTEMGALVTDDMVHAFGIVGPPNEIAGRLLTRYGDIVDRTSAAYANLPEDAQARIIAEITA